MNIKEYIRSIVKEELSEQNTIASGMVAGTMCPGDKDILSNPPADASTSRSKTIKEEEGVLLPSEYNLNSKRVIIKLQNPEKFSDEAKEVIKDFMKFCINKLELEEVPTIRLLTIKKPGMTTGAYDMGRNEICCLTKNRMLVDILRTLSHELTHRRQHKTGLLETELAKADPNNELWDIDTVYENEAYNKSGNFVKEFCRTYKKLDRDRIYEL